MFRCDPLHLRLLVVDLVGLQEACFLMPRVLFVPHQSLSLQNQPVEVRQSAGLVLKNSLKAGFENVNPAYLAYIRSELLRCIGLPDRALRNTVGTAISTIVEQQGGRGLGAWPELLQGIVQCLESNDRDHTEGALDALYKVSGGWGTREGEGGGGRKKGGGT